MRKKLELKRLELEWIRSTGIKIRMDAVGSKFTTISVGGPFEFLVEPQSEIEVSAALRFVTELSEPYWILGAGSNLLISDEGLSGWVIKLGRGFRLMEYLGSGQGGQERFSVGGAYSLMTLSRELSDNGYAGIEFASGIPATLGGALRMNAGAHGGEMANIVEEVTFVTREGQLVTVLGRELDWSYRYSSIPEGAVVTSAVLALTKGNRQATSLLRSTFLAERKKRQPLSSPSAGSVFRNPSPENPAGALIEEAGLKGCSIGGAKVSELHANWIVNESREANFSHVYRLMRICIDEVKAKRKILLEPEVKIWGSTDYKSPEQEII